MSTENLKNRKVNKIPFVNLMVFNIWTIFIKVEGIVRSANIKEMNDSTNLLIHTLIKLQLTH